MKFIPCETKVGDTVETIAGDATLISITFDFELKNGDGTISFKIGKNNKENFNYEDC